MRIATPDWTVLALFIAIVLSVTVYGLALSAHFPAEHRRASLSGPTGRLILWGTMAASGLAAAAAIRLGWAFLPGYAAVIAGGLAILAAPLVLKPLPDHLIDERRGLLVFAAFAATFAAISATL
jgi:hypothetical protein